MGLVQPLREFWYNNESGPFFVNAGGIYAEAITRSEIHTYGGSDPDFEDCLTCQTSEWLSRVKQQDLFRPHDCPTADQCKDLCWKQTSDIWTNLHRNHFFILGCNEELNAPRGLVYFPPGSDAKLWEIFNSRACEYHMHNLRAQFAQACQVDVVSSLPADISKYEFLFMMNTGKKMPLQDRPRLPLILYCHDMWNGGFQEALDFFHPEYILTPYPTPWTARYAIPDNSKVWFFPLLAGTFYTRPNLGKKDYDLLVIGVLGKKHYIPRSELDEQLKHLPSKYRIDFSHHVGCVSHHVYGPVVSPQDPTIRYMNKWSEYLGSSRYVIFGPCNPPYASEFLLMKYGECLGSGSIPIMPEVEDLKRFGVRPMEHYIPLSLVWENNRALEQLLDNYDAHKYIARNAVKWYNENADRMLYDWFEDLIQEITDFKYPRRLVC